MTENPIIDDKTKYMNTARIPNYSPKKPDGINDRGWQSLAVSKCLWGCENSPVFAVEN